MENNNTPDNSSGHAQTVTPNAAGAASGHGSQSPDALSGHGAPSQQSIGQSQTNLQTQPQFDPAQIESLRNSFNSKITEMGQSNAQLRQQLEAIQAKEQQFAQQLAQHYGFNGQQSQESIDPVNLLLENPTKFWELAAEKSGLKSKVESLEQERQITAIDNYLANQTLSKQEIAGKYTFLSDEMKEQVFDIRPFVPPRALEIERSLNDQFISEDQRIQLHRELNSIVAKTLNSVGGYEKVAQANMGKLLAENPHGFMQASASMLAQKNFAAQRAGSFGGNFTGGAATEGSNGNSGGGVNYVTEAFIKQ